jgi:hypothetical protein
MRFATRMTIKPNNDFSGMPPPPVALHHGNSLLFPGSLQPNLPVYPRPPLLRLSAFEKWQNTKHEAGAAEVAFDY